jgi:hypothetical protein
LGGDAFVLKVGGAPQNQPPSCTAAAAAPAVLWSPDHRLVPIAITGVTDPEGDPVVLRGRRHHPGRARARQRDPAPGRTCPTRPGWGRARRRCAPSGPGRATSRATAALYHIAFNGHRSVPARRARHRHRLRATRLLRFHLHRRGALCTTPRPVPEAGFRGSSLRRARPCGVGRVSPGCRTG